MKNQDFLNQKNPKQVPDFEVITSFNDPKKYIVPEKLMNALKLAIYLGQPLLLTGEAGTGKTQLAYAAADFFGLSKPLIFNTKTTSKAKDLLYTYDSLSHLHYVQAHPHDELTINEIERKFVRYQALGKAIRSENERRIILIDEIDKAPRDLPNDILDVIEQMWFEVPEIDRTDDNKFIGKTANRPIIILTSNSEKNLPDAFLRRCIFYYIEFPTPEKLIEILKTKFTNDNYTDQQWDLIVSHFTKVRKSLKRKKPATAELIFWVRALEKQNFDVNKINKPEEMNEQEKLILQSSYSILAKNTDDLANLK